MTNSRLMILVSLVLSAYAYPQKEVLKLEYDFFLGMADIVHYKSILLLSNDKSLFLWGKPIGEPKEAGEYEVYVNLNALDSIGSYTYVDKVKDSMYSRVPYFDQQSYLVMEPIVPMVWTITDELKKIGPYNCQKAKALFRGREYTAWFTHDIPISSGPWKLQGLPGLIINAFDNKGEVQFMLNSIVKSNMKITPDFSATKGISLKEYAAIQKSLSEVFYKKVKSRLPREVDLEITSQKSLEIFDVKD